MKINKREDIPLPLQSWNLGRVKASGVERSARGLYSIKLNPGIFGCFKAPPLRYRNRVHITKYGPDCDISMVGAFKLAKNSRIELYRV